MVVELVLKNDNLARGKCRIKTLIGDNDSSFIAAVRWLSPYAITKWSDFNHVSKTFNSKLYDMKLNATLREYFFKVFTLSVKKNKGDELKVKVALENTILYPLLLENIKIVVHSVHWKMMVHININISRMEIV